MPSTLDGAFSNLLARFGVQTTAGRIERLRHDRRMPSQWETLPALYTDIGAAPRGTHGPDNPVNHPNVIVAVQREGEDVQHYLVQDVRDGIDPLVRDGEMVRAATSLGRIGEWCQYTLSPGAVPKVVVFTPPTPPPLVEVPPAPLSNPTISYNPLPAPRRYFVVNPSGAKKIRFGSVVTYRNLDDFVDSTEPYGRELWMVGTAHLPLSPTPQDFYLDANAWGDYSRTGRVTHTIGFKHEDLSEGRPSRQKAPEPAPAPVATPAPLPVPEYRGTLTADGAGMYSLRHDVTAVELTRRATEPIRELAEGDLIPITGFFRIGDAWFGRAKSHEAYWWAIERDALRRVTKRAPLPVVAPPPEPMPPPPEPVPVIVHPPEADPDPYAPLTPVEQLALRRAGKETVPRPTLFTRALPALAWTRYAPVRLATVLKKK